MVHLRAGDEPVACRLPPLRQEAAGTFRLQSGTSVHDTLGKGECMVPEISAWNGRRQCMVPECMEPSAWNSAWDCSALRARRARRRRRFPSPLAALRTRRILPAGASGSVLPPGPRVGLSCRELLRCCLCGVLRVICEWCRPLCQHRKRVFGCSVVLLIGIKWRRAAGFGT
jgi:hypothetical protein